MNNLELPTDTYAGRLGYQPVPMISTRDLILVCVGVVCLGALLGMSL
jgi:hypothetical protein